MRTVFELLSSDGSIRARIRSASSGHESSPILSLRCRPKSILELVQIGRQEGPAVRFRGRGRGIRKLLCYFQPICCSSRRWLEVNCPSFLVILSHKYRHSEERNFEKKTLYCLIPNSHCTTSPLNPEPLLTNHAKISSHTDRQKLKAPIAISSTFPNYP